jgi:hypothetical protein
MGAELEVSLHEGCCKKDGKHPDDPTDLKLHGCLDHVPFHNPLMEMRLLNGPEDE